MVAIRSIMAAILVRFVIYHYTIFKIKMIFNIFCLISYLFMCLPKRYYFKSNLGFLFFVLGRQQVKF